MIGGFDLVLQANVGAVNTLRSYKSEPAGWTKLRKSQANVSR